MEFLDPVPYWIDPKETKQEEARQGRSRRRKGTPMALSSVNPRSLVMTHNGRPRIRRREVLSDRRGKRKFVVYQPVLRDGVPVTLKASEPRFAEPRNYWET